MTDHDETTERPDPHETYAVPRVPKSRGETLSQIKAEIQREMARRGGAYGRRLLDLTETLKAARRDFDANLKTLRASAQAHFGPQARGWSWDELLAQIGGLSPDAQAVLSTGVLAVEKSAERYRGLRAEAATVRQHLIIHREAMGFRRHHLVEEKFPQPADLPSLEEAWRRAPPASQETPLQRTE